MRKQRTVAAIDIGTTKVAVIVGDVGERGEARVLGFGVAPASGLARGVIDNIQSAREAISVAVEKAEQSSGMRILSAVVSLTGNHLASQNNRGIIAIPDRTRPITEDDRARVLDAASQVSIPTNRVTLHIVPRGYWIEGTEPVTDPVGMYGTRLDAETHIVTGAVSAIQNQTKCVEGAGVQVDDIVFEALASATSVLDPQERRQGVAVVDIGGGTTSMAVFDDGAIGHTAVFPIAGFHLTQDLASVLRCPWDNAERLKHEHGTVLPEAEGGGETVEVETFGTKRAREIPIRHLSEILQARCEEILEMAVLELRKSGYLDRIAAGLVLTGGTSMLPGIAEMAEERLGMPVRVGTPRGFSGLHELIAAPPYATAIGLVEYALAAFEPTADAASRTFDVSGGGLARRMKSAVRTFIP